MNHILEQSLDASDVAVCVKDANKRVLSQNDYCRKLCGEREGQTCEVGCMELYAKEAKKMQASLKDYPANEPKEETEKYWALNDVGTCLFIKGEVLLKKKDTAGAKAAFRELLKEYKFAQTWDPNGWFWKPAEAAKQKLVELDFDDE